MSTLVLLDFGGTIDADGERWSVRFYRAYRRLGGEQPFDAYQAAFVTADHLLDDYQNIGSMGLTEMVQAQAELIDDLLSEPRAPNPAAVARDFLIRARRVVQRNLPILAGLRSGHRLGVVSNFTGNLEHCLRELGIRSLFEVVADSALVGFRKPELRIFRWAFERAPADQVWMVGDNFEADIRPAAGLGWNTCWVSSDRNPPPDDLATIRIAGLHRLPGALARCMV